MNLLTVILAPLALLILIAGSFVFLRSPHRAAIFLLAVYLADTLWVGLPAIPLGLHIYAQDIVFVLLIIAALLRYVLGMAHIERSRLAVLTLFLLVLFSLARGIVDYGPTQAGVESRGFFWLFAGIVYFSSFEYSGKRLADMIRLWQQAACALVAIALFRWIATGLHLGIAASWAEPDAPAMRVLDASDAMFLCVAFFFSIALRASHKGSRWQQKLYYVVGPALILLQHRTVWVITAIGMAWIFRRYARIMRRSLFAFAVTACACGALVTSVFGLDLVMDSLQQSATSDGTLLWRVAGWYQLLFLRSADAWRMLFGDPFGTGFERMIANARIDVTPHNFYIETYLRLGIAGLCILLWFFVSQLRACRRLALQATPSSTYVNPRIWGLFLLFQMTFSLTYNPGYEQCIIFGIIVGMNALGSTTSELANVGILSELMLPEPS